MNTRRLFSRRSFLGVVGGAAAGSVLVACAGAPASPTAPAPASGAATKSGAAPTTAPAAAATQPAAVKPSGAGAPVVVWQGVDYLVDVTGLMKQRFEAVAKEKNIQLTFEELAGNVAGDRFTASIQANTPPDIWRLFDYEAQYWRRQGQTADVTDVVKPLMAQKGGFWQSVEMTCTYQGKWFSVPHAVNAWPFHVRQDLLDKAGVKWPATWDEFRQQGRQMTKPPLYYYGMTLAKDADDNNHFTGMLWSFGGKLQNDDGSLGVKAGDQAWIATLELIQAMFNQDKIIPPGALNWDAGSNNQGYQSEQLVATSNPTSIYNWLKGNKPELAKGTKFYNYPAGPAGSFGQVDVWSQGLFKNGKGGDGARTLLSAFLDPTWYGEYINQKLQGRFIPVYKDLLKDDLWTKNPLYDQYQKIIENGRIMAYAGVPNGGTTELLTKYVIGDMMQDLLVKKVKPADALATFVKSAEEIYAKPENKG